MIHLISAKISRSGRIDKSMLTEHQMMELFSIPSDFDIAIRSLKGDAGNACAGGGGGVDFSETHKVCKINWYGLPYVFISVEGSMDFSMMPRNLSFLNLYAQRLEGYVSRTALPARMQLFCIEECDFSGTIEMEHFPRSLQVFKSHENSIEALTKLRNLPESMELRAQRAKCTANKCLRRKSSGG